MEYEEVTVRRGTTFRLLEPAGLTLSPDGEFYGVTPAEIRGVPRELAVFTAAS